MSLIPTNDAEPEPDAESEWPRDDFPRRRRIRLRTIVKWSLCLLVLAFVFERGYDLWQDSGDAVLHVDAGWLVLSGFLYLVAWLPSVWVWRELMRALGESVGLADAARAYYCGHLGKYVPGKLLVPLIRAKLMQERGARFIPCALTAVYETLLMMGAGLAIGLALLPFTGWPTWLSDMATFRVLVPAFVILGCMVFLPLISRLLSFIAMFAAAPALRAGRIDVRIRERLIALSLAAFTLTWLLQGLSLGVTLRATGQGGIDWSQWPVWTGAMAISTSVGFLVLFAPGGIGVREGLLMEVLKMQPGIGDKQVVAAAILTRLVSFFAEIAAAAALYYLIRNGTKRVEVLAPDDLRGSGGGDAETRRRGE
jgi:uncharacterized membrane protein YbhN (UPF0104 family)